MMVATLHLPANYNPVAAYLCPDCATLFRMMDYIILAWNRQLERRIAEAYLN